MWTNIYCNCHISSYSPRSVVVANRISWKESFSDSPTSDISDKLLEYPLSPPLPPPLSLVSLVSQVEGVLQLEEEGEGGVVMDQCIASLIPVPKEVLLCGWSADAAECDSTTAFTNLNNTGTY